LVRLFELLVGVQDGERWRLLVGRWRKGQVMKVGMSCVEIEGHLRDAAGFLLAEGRSWREGELTKT
jgi:hypothetical protein